VVLDGGKAVRALPTTSLHAPEAAAWFLGHGGGFTVLRRRPTRLQYFRAINLRPCSPRHQQESTIMICNGSTALRSPAFLLGLCTER
jgi:hypothetical protein